MTQCHGDTLCSERDFFCVSNQPDLWRCQEFYYTIVNSLSVLTLSVALPSFATYPDSIFATKSRYPRK